MTLCGYSVPIVSLGYLYQGRIMTLHSKVIEITSIQRFTPHKHITNHI